MSKEQTPKNWIDFQQEQMEKSIREDCQKAMYTAQEGSTLDKIWKGEFMSKEQTPIGELETRLNVMSSQEFIDWLRHEGIKKLKLSEQIKVLEALEREVPKALSRGAYLAITKIDVVNTGIEPYIEDYIETEVKPKYE